MTTAAARMKRAGVGPAGPLVSGDFGQCGFATAATVRKRAGRRTVLRVLSTLMTSTCLRASRSARLSSGGRRWRGHGSTP